MNTNILDLLNCYTNIERIESSDWLYNFSEEFLSYHKIDMLFLYACKQFSFKAAFHEELVHTKNLIMEKNERYFEIAALLSNKLNEHNIPHVFLKGIACLVDFYPEKWIRYFGDIDLLTDKPYLKQTEKIVQDMGYIYGDTPKNSSVILPATRSDVIFSRAFTHELHNMTKKEDETWASNIDINFMFAWNFQNDMVCSSVKELQDHIITSKGIALFDRIVNLIHMCCHLHSEAVFFALDKNFHKGDPMELKLNRVFDIAILSNLLSSTEIFDMAILAEQKNCLHKVKYAFKVLNILFNHDFTKGNPYLLENFDDIDIDSYYAKDQKIMVWPISLTERVFNLEHKRKVCNKLFP